MGRTNATYRDLLRALEERWQDYRRGLRLEDQPHFDRLFTHARNHADASGLQNHEDPIVPALFSIALAQERRLAAYETRVDEIESQLETLESRVRAVDDLESRLAALETRHESEPDSTTDQPTQEA